MHWRCPRGPARTPRHEGQPPMADDGIAHCASCLLGLEFSQQRGWTIPRVEGERPPESGSTGPLGRLGRLTCTRGAGAAGWALRTTARPAGTGSGPRASEMRRGLVFRTRQSSHKKSKEISACGNFSAQMRINELAFFSPGVNKHEQFGAAAVGAWAFSFIRCPVLHTAFGRAGPGQQALGEC